MATFKINGKNFATQDGTGEPTVSSNVIVYVNMGSSSSATVTVIPTPVTV